MQMAPYAGGLIDTIYRRVPCTPISNLVVDVDANACAYGWLRMGITVCSAASQDRPSNHQALSNLVHHQNG